MELQIDLLKTFLAVIDTGGFTNAAQVVHRSQSAISLQVKRLEEAVQKTLFMRSGRSFSLTAEGEVLVPYARRMLKLHEETLAAMMTTEVVGAVRLGIIDDYASRFLPAILSTFSNTYPDVQVTVQCEPSTELLSSLAKGKLDLVLVTGSLDEKGDVIRYEPAVWVTSANHLVHEESPLPLAVYHRESVNRKWPMEALEKIGKTYRVAYESPNDTGIQAIVSAGLAVSILYKSVVPVTFRILSAMDGFPDLPVAKIVLKQSPGSLSKAVECMAQHIRDGMR